MSLYISDIASAYENGQTLYRSWSKAPTQATSSGIWFDLSMSPGNPPAQYYFATPLIAAPLARSTDGGLDHGPNVSPSKKYLHKILVQTVLATAVPLTLELMDYLMFYPGIAMDVGVQTLTTGITLPRYPTGAGVMMMAIEQNPYVGSARFAVTYTNQNGIAGRVTPTFTCNTQTVAGTVATSASTQAGACGRFLALQQGDSGVRSIDSIEFFSSDVGLLALVLVYPLATIQISEVNSPCEYDLLRDFSILPRIEDDAYLNFIALPVGTLASAQILGSLTTLWST